MFSKQNIIQVFSLICITSLISCSNFSKKESDEKIMTGEIMKLHDSAQSNTNTEKNQIKLYVYRNCPYCHKVINYLKSINQLDKITVVDVGNTANMQELLALNKGNTQCPFLHDPEKNMKMLESDDIIKHLSTRF